jgi:hypothetical protein
MGSLEYTVVLGIGEKGVQTPASIFYHLTLNIIGNIFKIVHAYKTS